MSKFINAYKSASSRLIKKAFSEVRRNLWKEMFWSRSYCLLMTDGAPIETIRKYIENQGDIVNIGLHFFHKDVRLMLPLVVKHSIVAA